MAKYYQDFVGLNTFIYETNGWHSASQTTPAGAGYEYYTWHDNGLYNTSYLVQNTLGQSPMFRLHMANAGSYHNPRNNQTTLAYRNARFMKSPWNKMDFPKRWSGGGTTVHQTASFFNALMLHRNGPYGFPMWKQLRISDNPIIRKQRLHNVFTHVQEPGRKYQITINGKQYDHHDKYGNIGVYTEPVVNDEHKPLELFGGTNFYNPKTNMSDLKSVQIKSSFGNEIAFFENSELNRYYETVEETDENYEQLKDLYLNDGLDDDSSPIERFNMLIYKQTVFPKSQYAFLNRTRSRTKYANMFWSGRRLNRNQKDVDNGFGYYYSRPSPYLDAAGVPSQSMWPLDVDTGWASRPSPVSIVVGTTTYINWKIGASGSSNPVSTPQGGWNSGLNVSSSGVGGVSPGFIDNNGSAGGSGILLNSYAQLCRGYLVNTSTSKYLTTGQSPYSTNALINMDFMIKPAPVYARRNTMTYQSSMVSPAGMDIAEINRSSEIPITHLFEGVAAWDVPAQSGKHPFYDSYDKYALDVKLKGKGYTIVPEFRISSHVQTYLSKSVVTPLESIFELTGAENNSLSALSTNTQNNPQFYKVLSNSDFLKHFDLIKKDHADFTQPAVITLRCKALKKFLPYKGFYPVERTVQLAEQFYDSYGDYIKYNTLGNNTSPASDVNYSRQIIMQPLFAPGVLFNTIKAGVACDWPVNEGTGTLNYRGFASPTVVIENWSTQIPTNGVLNYCITGSNNWETNHRRSVFSRRIPFEALVEPERYLSNSPLYTMESHPFGFGSAMSVADTNTNFSALWDGNKANPLYIKMANNFLAEVPEFFLETQNFTSIASMESSNPQFGNVTSGSFYAMRIKMRRSMDKPNDLLYGWKSTPVAPPQALSQRTGMRETFTMYSRPSAFGPDIWGSGSGDWTTEGVTTTFDGCDSFQGFNFCYTPPYYHGDAWCDLILEATASGKMPVSDIVNKVKKFPFYCRFWWPGENVAMRDLGLYGPPRTPYVGYRSGPWANSGVKAIHDNADGALWDRWIDQMTETTHDGTVMAEYPNPIYAVGMAPQHPRILNWSALQMNSSVNLFGIGFSRKTNFDDDGNKNSSVEVFSADSVGARSRWVIQPKFETPMLNFNKYTNLDENNCTKPLYATSSVPRGMWHQYGELPTGSEGVFLEVGDLPDSWLHGGLGLEEPERSKYKSLADLCGFKKKSKRLGTIASVKEISEAVVAIPFIQEKGERKFFSIPRKDIDDTISALNREVEPGVFVAGGPPRTGDSVIQMVKKMKKYVFPPSMDFVRYNQIQPFAMYIFEFKHNLTRQDLANIWQNVSPTIGTSFEEAEATISHQLLAHELIGKGAIAAGSSIDEDARTEIPSNIQWMIFKAKKRAATEYFDKVVEKSGRAPKSALQMAFEREEEKVKRKEGEDPDITYNWPYDFFSLVELVKLDAEVTFSEVEIDEKGTKTFKPKKKMPPALRRERKLKQKAKRKALGKSGALAPGKEDPTLLEKAQDLIGKAKDKLSELNEKRKAKKAARKKKRGERKDKRKDKRADNKSKRKDKKKNKKKNRKDKRKNKKKNKKR